MKYLFIVGVLVYFSAVFNGFVGDDTGYINHPYIQKFQLSKLVLGSSSDLGGSSPITGQFYRPIMLLNLSLLYQIFGQQAWGYHVFQISLAVINSYLVYFLFRKFFDKKLSLFLAIIFLIHPINSETVLYVSNLQEVLMMMGGMVGILVVSYQLSVVSLCTSILAKETGVVFVIIALVMKKINWKQAIMVIGSYGLIRALAGVGFGGGVERIASFSPEIVWYYLKTFFWPAKLAIGQTWMPEVSSFQLSVVSWSIIGLVISLLVIKRKYWFWGGWVILGLLPHLQIIPLEMTVADRWGYIMTIGLLGLIGQIGQIGLLKNKYIWIVIIILLGIRTMVRVQDFRSYERLLEHDSRVTESYLLEQALGYVKNSKEHTQKSIDLKPNPVNTNTMGYLYYHEGNSIDAKKWWRESIKLGDNFQAYNNLTRVLLGEEKWDEAKPIIEAGKAKFPQSNLFWQLEKYMLEKQNL